LVALSAVIITFNEEENIQRCIESLQGIADEVLVIDSLSTDNTVAIAEQLGAKVYSQPFLGHKEQKNYAAAKANYDYILSLDADEVLSEQLASSILKTKAAWKCDVYKFNRLNNYCGAWVKHCGWYPDNNARLWRKNMASWGGQNPHDKLIPSPGATIGNLDGDLLHYTYTTISGHVAKVNYFSSIAAEAKYKEEESVSIFNIIFSPIVKFAKMYVLQFGILDGYNGLTISAIESFGTFLKYVKLYNKYKEDER
jgi:glycosyltransferase involved in cell wall biosynthesis